jgi:hypothetical protein
MRWRNKRRALGVGVRIGFPGQDDEHRRGIDEHRAVRRVLDTPHAGWLPDLATVIDIGTHSCMHNHSGQDNRGVNFKDLTSNIQVMAPRGDQSHKGIVVEPPADQPQRNGMIRGNSRRRYERGSRTLGSLT